MLPPPGSPGSHSPAQAAPMASKEMEVGCRQDGDGKGNTQSASIKLSRALQSPAMEKSHRELTAAAVGQGKTASIPPLVSRAWMSSLGGREVTPRLPLMGFLTFLFYIWQPVSDSLWQFLQSLAVLKGCNTDLGIQIGKAVF